jgi:hypothetical protein
LAVRQQIARQFVNFPKENNEISPCGDAVLWYKTAGRAMLAPAFLGGDRKMNPNLEFTDPGSSFG